MENDKDKFTFAYSAPTQEERREIEEIKKYYLSSAEKTDKITTLRRLDKKVKTMPTALSVICGVLGILIFGFGLTMCLEWNHLVWGAVVSIVGCIPAGCAYPLYNRLIRHNKQKYADEILKLSNELLNE